MAERLVIGLFHSSGIALDAVHRLVTEGVSSSDIAQRVLKEVGPVPALETDLASMLLDPLLVGNARETFAHHIRNGETAVFVRAVTDEQVEFASDIPKLYLPITIEVLSLPRGIRESWSLGTSASWRLSHTPAVVDGRNPFA